MNTNDDADGDMRPEYDWSRATRAAGPRFPEGFGIVIDGAIGYSLRPSRTKVEPSRSSRRRGSPKGRIPAGEPGWYAGRLIDGLWCVQDGRDPVWRRSPYGS